MNAKDIVAVILGLTVMSWFIGMFVVRVMLPTEIKPEGQLLEMYQDIVGILAGGLLTWIGAGRGGKSD